MKRLSVLVAVVLVVLMVHARGGCAVAVSPLASCTADCLGVDDNVQIPDPYNCTQFYLCMEEIPRGPFPCYPGNEFSEADGECVSSGVEECKPICGATKCTADCTGLDDNVQIPDPYNCTQYYICIADEPRGPFSCPDGNEFSEADGGCVSSGVEGCKPICGATKCTADCLGVDDNVQIPVPYNCTEFYVCLEEIPRGPFPCDPGNEFSEVDGQCVSSGGLECKPICGATKCTADCTGLDDNVLIPVPYNCTEFYLCMEEIPRGPFPCDPGNEFSEVDQGCVSSGVEKCKPICGATNCPLTCDGNVLVIGSAFDCNIYYFCTVEGPSEVQHCLDPEKPYYDGNSFSCSNDPSVCCSGYCTPYCSGPGLTPDPNSCTGYYVCLEEGDVDEGLHTSCNVGDVFSEGIGDCVPDTGEPCITLCDTIGRNGERGIHHNHHLDHYHFGRRRQRR